MKMQDSQKQALNQKSETQITRNEVMGSAIKKVEDSDENYEDEQYASA